MPYYTAHSQAIYSSKELFNLLYENPDLDLSKFVVSDADSYLDANTALHTDFPKMQKSFIYVNDALLTREEFDKKNQSNWYMPEEYKSLDIAKWILDQCKTDAELQRVGQELLLFQERDLFDLLRFLKYMVDTMREHNILWGVGRGSSVASYVLYLLGVHKIDSIYYDLDIREFLRE